LMGMSSIRLFVACVCVQSMRSAQHILLMLRAARAVHRCGGLACDANFSSLDLSKRTVVDASTSLRLAECVSTGRGHRLQLGRSGKAMAGRQLTASSKPVASGMPCVECRSACGGSGPPATAAGTQVSLRHTEWLFVLRDSRSHRIDLGFVRRSANTCQ